MIKQVVVYKVIEKIKVKYLYLVYYIIGGYNMCLKSRVKAFAATVTLKLIMVLMDM